MAKIAIVVEDLDHLTQRNRYLAWSESPALLGNRRCQAKARGSSEAHESRDYGDRHGQ
jgi:hypothetical protein